MAKRYTHDNKPPVQQKTSDKTGGKRHDKADNALDKSERIPAEGNSGYITNTWIWAIISVFLIFVLTLAGSMDNTVEKGTGLLAAVLIIVLIFTAARGSEVWKNTLTPLFLSFTVYIIWAGVSTFYAASGKFAIFEFSKLLVALGIFLAVVFLTEPGEQGFKRISYIFASVGCFYGIISVDAASFGIFSKIFKSIFGIFTRAFDSNGAFESGIRISGIFGNPNIYAGIMAIAVLLSLYLTIHASDKKNSRISAVLLAVNSLSYLLAFSMGSLFIFAVACLVMIGISEKGRRVSVFLLMLETVILTFLFAFLSITGLGKTGAVSVIPIAALVLNAVLLCLLDERLRPALSEKLNANIKLIFGTILVIVIFVSGYFFAAFQVSSEMTLGEGESVMRAIYVPGGEYSLRLASSAPVDVSVTSQNQYDLMRHTSSTLYSETSGNAIAFTVPDDSEIVQVTFASPKGNAEITRANYTGAENGNIHLNYPLLPNFIANRIQNLFANENAVQRTIFFEDGIKLFKRSPVIGRGLGGFENGVYSVQDFFYETKYAHNHYIQALSDLGIVGLVLYLFILIFSILSIIQSKKHMRSLYEIPVLSACIVQMFGQAVTDATWSTGTFLGFAAAVLALITVFCAEPVRWKALLGKGWLRIAEKTLLGIFAGIFILLLTGNLYAHMHAKAGVKSFEDIEKLMILDRFEYNDFKLSYVVNAAKSDDTDIMEKAGVYAKELLNVESNSLAPYVMVYDFQTYKDLDAFEAAKNGIKNAASYPKMWSRIFDICEEYIDPVGPYTDDAADRLKTPEFYVDGVLELYDALLERNKNSLDQITLNPYNSAFLGKLLEIRATHLYSTDWVFTAIMTYVFDSECAVDTNQDGIPDNLVVKSGGIQRNHDGLLAVTDHTMIDLTLYQKLHGKYTFMVKTDTPKGIKISIDGNDQEVLYTSNEAYITIDLADNSEMKLSNIQVTFPAAAVIDYMTYTTELE